MLFILSRLVMAMIQPVLGTMGLKEAVVGECTVKRMIPLGEKAVVVSHNKS